MKPYLPSIVTSTQHKTQDYRISRARIVVENVYGRLKARSQRLMKRNDMFVDNIPLNITAACILHNMCEVRTYIGKVLTDYICHNVIIARMRGSQITRTCTTHNHTM